MDLPGTGGAVDAVGVIAVGGPGAEVLKVPRESIGERALIETWIARISAATVGTAVDWTAREAGAGSAFELAPGEQLRGAARGVAWASCDRGEVRFMGLEMAINVGDPPLPLASGTWVKAAGGAAIRVRSEPPTGGELRRAIDRFHLLAMECIRLRLVPSTIWNRGSSPNEHTLAMRIGDASDRLTQLRADRALINAEFGTSAGRVLVARFIGCDGGHKMSDSAHTVSEFTVPPRATRQCGRTGRLDSLFAGLMEKIMSKTTMQNSKARLRELKEELSEEQLQKVYGGKASFHDLNFVHKLDKASPVLMQA